MMELELDWHVAKAEANLRIHGVSLELAKAMNGACGVSCDGVEHAFEACRES